MISCKPRLLTASYIRLCSENSDAIADGNSMTQQGLDWALLKSIPHLIVFRSSAERSKLRDFDRTLRTEPVGEASVPVDNPAR